MKDTRPTMLEMRSSVLLSKSMAAAARPVSAVPTRVMAKAKNRIKSYHGTIKLQRRTYK
jgi:hypothetical protein